MSLQDAIALAVVTASATYLARAAWRALVGGKSGCCDRPSCGSAAAVELIQIRPAPPADDKK